MQPAPKDDTLPSRTSVVLGGMGASLLERSCGLLVDIYSLCRYPAYSFSVLLGHKCLCICRQLLVLSTGSPIPGRPVNSQRSSALEFSHETVENAWVRARGRCECQQAAHVHHGRCNRELVWEARGRDAGGEAWEAHALTPGPDRSGDTVPNCRILCWECYRQISEVFLARSTRGGSRPTAPGNSEPTTPSSLRPSQANRTGQSMD